MSKRNTSSFLINRTLLYGFFLIASVVILGTLFVRNKPLEYYDRTEYYLGTYVTIKVASSSLSPTALAQAAMNEVERIDEKFGGRKNGILAELNLRGEAFDLDDETIFLIKSTLEVAKNTAGAFDPTLYSLTKLWGFDEVSTQKRIPDEIEIENALADTNYEKIIFDEAGKHIKLESGSQLDLSGIAKGYAVDMAVAKIRALDPNATGFIDAGGDIGIIGPKYGNRPWIIGLRNPRGESVQDVIEYIYLYDGSIATSGDYERFFVVDGIRYHHILDPSTGKPAKNGTISATVISNSAMLADAYATAAFVIGKAPGITFFPRYGALAFLVMEDMSTFKSPGFEVYQKK